MELNMGGGAFGEALRTDSILKNNPFTIGNQCPRKMTYETYQLEWTHVHSYKHICLLLARILQQQSRLAEEGTPRAHSLSQLSCSHREPCGNVTRAAERAGIN